MRRGCCSLTLLVAIGLQACGAEPPPTDPPTTLPPPPTTEPPPPAAEPPPTPTGVPPPAAEPPPPAAEPPFPWPPPRASATEVVPREFLVATAGGPIPLSVVDDRLTEALEQSGYFESSYFGVPGGFALVTRLEQIESDGTPKAGDERWSLGTRRLSEFSLAAYFRALFLADPGYYRVIALVVTPQPFSQSDDVVTSDQAEAWLAQGLDRVPPTVATLIFTEDFACTALIYEFERQSESDEAGIKYPSAIQGRTHLQRSGIWEALQP